MRYKNIVTGEIVDEQILICDYNDDFKLLIPSVLNHPPFSGGMIFFCKPSFNYKDYEL